MPLRGAVTPPAFTARPGQPAPNLRDAVVWLDSIPAPAEVKMRRGAVATRVVLRRSRRPAGVTVAFARTSCGGRTQNVGMVKARSQF